MITRPDRRRGVTYVRPSDQIVAALIKSFDDWVVDHGIGEVHVERVFHEVEDRLASAGVPGEVQCMIPGPQ